MFYNDSSQDGDLPEIETIGFQGAGNVSIRAPLQLLPLLSFDVNMMMVEFCIGTGLKMIQTSKCCDGCNLLSSMIILLEIRILSIKT